MSASLVFTFNFIAPNTSTSVFIHGYADNEAVNYSAVVFPQVFGGGAGGPIMITQGETFRHVDGTVGRKVYVQNPDPATSFAVNILQTVESF
jgi:hypothetical protein